MQGSIDIGAWISDAVDFILAHFGPALDGFSYAVGLVTNAIQDTLLFLPAWALVAILVLLSLWRVGKGLALFALLALGLVYGMGLWEEMVSTLALVLAASLIALLFGIPLGIAMARSDIVKAITRPVLDLMQTMPSFVYLIPAAMFFGLGQVPGTIATVIFAMPPAVRLTDLGIREVDAEHVEAGLAFGCTRRQLLLKVQLPLAMPSIMAGVNQTIMLALSMVVIASMIGAGGLGSTVLTGIQRLDVGQGFQGGIAVVILAVILDRITQSFGRGSGGLSEALGLGSLLRKLSGRPGTTKPAA
jgi:glycine betaine/proline transport system permease protein